MKTKDKKASKMSRLNVNRLLITLSKVYPKKYTEHFKQHIIFAGERRPAEFWLGSSILYSTLLFLAVIITNLFLGLSIPYIILFLIIAVIIPPIGVYLVIYFKEEARTEKIEKALPDALQLIASNIRSGMTPFHALRLASRGEFGPLKDEIDYVTTKAFGAESLSAALVGISQRVRSHFLDRAMKLFASALRSGGRVAKLLEETAQDIAETRSLKKEMVTTTKTYTMFILFTVTFGTPALLAISVHFLEVISNVQANIGVDVGFGMGGLMSPIMITASFLFKAAIVILLLTTIFASMLIGTIKEGKPKSGLKYAPLLIGGSFLVFFVARIVIGSFIGGMTL